MADRFVAYSTCAALISPTGTEPRLIGAGDSVTLNLTGAAAAGAAAATARLRPSKTVSANRCERTGRFLLQAETLDRRGLAERRFVQPGGTVIGRTTDDIGHVRPTLRDMTAVTANVQCPILVGRDEILDLADNAVADAAAGHGRTLVFAGEAGIGKTRLVQSIVRKARGNGFRYAGGDLVPQDADLPLAALRDLFRTMVLVDDGLADLGDELLARCDEAAAKGDAYSRALVLELVDRIRRQIDKPTLLRFDDLQWADDITLEAVGELARTCSELPLLVIGVYRRDETPPGAPFRAWRSRLLTQRLAEEIQLERLSYADTATMTTLLLATGMPAGTDVARAVYERSDGLPLHIEELIAAARANSETIDAAAIRAADVPDTIEDAIRARAAGRSKDAQLAAQAGAVMGRCFEPSVLAGVMDRPVEELEGPLQELVDHGILYGFSVVDVGYFDFRHQLLRDTLYRATPERDRRRYHARAGEFGATLVGATEVHASLHYERAGLPELAYKAARAGAEEAARLSAHRESFELYRRAVANMPEDISDLERAQLLERYGDQAAAIEENELAEQVFMSARAAYASACRPDLAAFMLSAVQTFWRRAGRPIRERTALAQQAESELMGLEPSADVDEALMNVAFDRLVIEVDANELNAARRTGAAVLEASRKLGDAGAERFIQTRLAMIDVLSGDPDAGLAAMARIADDCRQNKAEEAGVTAFRDTAVMATRALDYGAAAAALAEGLVYSDSVQQSQCAHVMLALTAETGWAAGSWDQSIPAAQQAIADRGCPRAPAMARWPLAYIAFGRGDFDRARELLNEALAFGDQSEMIEWRLPPAWGLAETALLAGDTQEAIDRCEAALELCIQKNERALLAQFVVTGVRAYLTAGRPSDAERWLSRCAAHLAATPAFGRTALDHGAGLVALAAGSTGTARTSLEAAVSGWDRHGRIWEASWARLDLATAHIRASKFAAAVAIAAEVRETATRLDSPSLLRRADELLRQARGRVAVDEPWRPLTAREFDVARLISEGLTNAEIADELGIAPKTASSHVEHILAKLGASRRAEIATWAASVDRSAVAH
jgi:DNA-binding CsgD family transcriptional regulator/tetratricopeptide (TPR) repeat protein